MGRKAPPPAGSVVEPWGPQQPYLRDLLGRAGHQMNQGAPQYFQGNMVAGRNPAETWASQYTMGLAQNQLPYEAQRASGAANFGLNAMDIANNQYVKDYAVSAARPVTDNLMESIIPQLRLNAAGGGQAGSSRAGIAEGLASAKATQQIADQTAGIYNNAYGQGLDTYGRTLAQLPAIQQMQLMPSIAASAVGDNQRAYEQSLIDAAKGKWDYEQMAPWLTLAMYQGLIQGNYGGTTTPTQQRGMSWDSSDWMNLAGGMALGGLAGMGGG